MRFRIGWKRDGKWRYITVNSRPEMLEEVADKTLLGDCVTVKQISDIRLEGGKKNA